MSGDGGALPPSPPDAVEAGDGSGETVDPFAEADEYAALSLGMSLPLASLLCFLVALAARPLAALLPRGLVGYPWRVLLPALLVPTASLLGLLLGLLGLGSPQGRGLAQLGILVNAVGLVLGALFLLAFFYILGR